MKILYVGQFFTPQYDEAMARGMESAGCEVRRFGHHEWIGGVDLLSKVQTRLLRGPNYSRLHQAVLEEARQFQPDAVYFRRPVEFPKEVVLRLKQETGAVLASYMNDDPFGPDRDKSWFRHFHRTLPLFDVHFCFRKANIAEFVAAGAGHCEVLLPYYVPEMHYPRTLTAQDDRFKCDAVFIGHGEPDVRRDYFDAILEHGFDLQLYGSHFSQFAGRRPHRRLLPTRFLFEDEYARSCQLAGCVLCIFSRRNRDLLTTRVFETPANGGLLVAERNPLIQDLFREGEEAFYFSDVLELVDIVQRMKRENGLRERVIAAGRERLMKSGHSVYDRARQVVATLRKAALGPSLKVAPSKRGLEC